MHGTSVDRVTTQKPYDCTSFHSFEPLVFYDLPP